MPLLILSIVFQIAFVVHVLKTGRNTFWVTLLIMLPLVGPACYFIVEILPELTQGSTGRKVKKSATILVNPNKDIKAATRNYAASGTADNARKLAAELIETKQYIEAGKLCQESLNGLYEFDPTLLVTLALSQYHTNQFSATKATLDLLIEKNPEYKNPDAHLLYARTLEELGDNKGALEEYEAICEYMPTPEHIFHYGQLMQEQGMSESRQVIYQKTLEEADLAPRYYQKQHRYWLAQIKASL